MKTKAGIYIIAAVVIGVFFVANWAMLSAPIPLNLVFAQVETPLAVLLLLCAGVVLLLDFVVYALHHHAWRIERKRLAAELAGAQLRADSEEESRTQALRIAVEREFAAVRAQLDRVVTGVQRLENDTMEVAHLVAPAIEPELIPPHSVQRQR